MCAEPHSTKLDPVLTVDSCLHFFGFFTWGAVWDAHDSLERAFRMVQTGDGQWRARTEAEVRDEFEWLHECRDAVASWPGPICGVCWGASCWQCGYVFEDASDAAARLGGVEYGRLLCAGCRGRP